MGNTAKQAPDSKLQKLGTLRVALCVIAVALCGSIVISAVNLRPKPKEADTKETETAENATEAQPISDPSLAPSEIVTNPNESEEVVTVPTGDADQASSSSDGFGAPTSTEKNDPNIAKIPSDDTTPLEKRGEATDAETTEPLETPDSELSETPDSEQPATPGAEQSATPGAEQPATPGAEQPAAPSWPLPMLIGSIVLLALDAIGIGVCSQSIQHRKHELRQQRRRAAVAAATATAESEDEIIHTQSLPEQPVPGRITVGSLQNIGGRPYQEDSSGVANLSDGALAVVADGMGGLSNGDKVSQKIIFTMMGFAKALRPGQMDGVLFQMVKGTVDVVNRMLGKDGLYKSGSTLMAVLVRGNRFHWIAVGDSHIYLFRDGQLIQLNQEHNRGQDLLRHAIAGELTFDEVRADPKKSGLTSFIGMGEIKYVEKSLDSIALHPGDRIVLMTDGVFNALSDSEIAAVLAQNPDVKTAARMMEQGVLSKAAPHQDNFTAVILGL